MWKQLGRVQIAELRMHESRPIFGSPMEIDWYSRRTLLNRTLLIAALLLATLGVASLLTRPIIRLEWANAPAIALLISAVWLLLTYLFSRMRRAALSGWMLVAFSLIWFGLALYSFPSYLVALFPAALLPVGIAVAALNRTAVIAAAAAALSIILAFALGTVPAPSLQLALPLTQVHFGLLIICFTTLLLSIMLLPLRGTNTGLRRELALRNEAEVRTVAERVTLEQERATIALTAQRQRQYIEALVGRMRDGAISVNAAGEIVLTNPVARQLLAETSYPTNGRLLLSSVETALTPKQGESYGDLVSLPTFELGPEEAFTHMLLDRREEARLARLRGELLGLLTDEMCNPLTSMVTALDLTLGQQHLPDDIDRVLIGARQSGQRLLELVTMLLEISQIEQDPTVLRRDPTSLLRVIEAGIAQMSPLAQRGAVTVSVEHAGDSALLIDSVRIQRSFCYLLEQALRQSPPYSVVQVRTRRAEAELIVQISDQGPGRSAQLNEHILRQGGDERNASSLGLIYSKLVIEAHGGRIWAENNGTQGSSYSFALPLDQQELISER